MESSKGRKKMKKKKYFEGATDGIEDVVMRIILSLITLNLLSHQHAEEKRRQEEEKGKRERRRDHVGHELLEVRDRDVVERLRALA